MSFVSYLFIGFVFVLMVLYFIVPLRIRCYVLLAGSLFFYYQSGWQGMVFIGIAALITYGSGLVIGHLRMSTPSARGGSKKEGTSHSQEESIRIDHKDSAFAVLMLSMLFLIAMLAYAKTGNYIVDVFDQAFQGEPLTVSVIIPLGISYYTFAAIGYLADVYWKKDQAEKNPFKLMLYLCYFPQILQGPIPKHKKLAPLLSEGHRFDYDRVCFGLQRAVWGFFKKLVIADRLAIMVNQVFNNYQNYSGFVYLVGLTGAVFQLYADFSGCMDIALGVSEVFGITLEENFKRPFFSTSAAEFWRRWHISLGAWFKDYVYMPLSTASWVIAVGKFFRNHVSKSAGRNIVTTIPLLVVWILTGLWHGTGADYLVWGLYWGGIIILSTWLAPVYRNLNQRFGLTNDLGWWRVVRQIRTFVIYMIGRLLTLPGDLLVSFWIGQKVFTFNPWVFSDGTLLNLGWDEKDVWVVCIALLILWRVSVLQEKGIRIRQSIAKWPLPIRWAFYLGAIFAVLIFGVYGAGTSGTTFVYMNY